MTEREFTARLGWPGYKVYRHEIDEAVRTPRHWVGRRRGNKVLICANRGGAADRAAFRVGRQHGEGDRPSIPGTVVSDLLSREPLWMGPGRKEETSDEYFREELSHLWRSRIEAACVDVWEPFTKSILKWIPDCKIVFNKFHVMQHANRAVDEVRHAEFSRKGGQERSVVKGKRWLLLTRWMNLDGPKKQLLNELFGMNRRLMKAYLMKESLDRLWTYTYEGAARSYLNRWIDQFRIAAARAFSKACGHAGAPRGGPVELLPDEGALWRGRGHQWGHQGADPAWPRISEHALSIVEGTEYGGYRHRVDHAQESSLNQRLLHIPAQSPLRKAHTVWELGNGKGAKGIY